MRINRFMDILSFLQNEPLIKKITALGRKYDTKVYLVGGFLRDLLLETELLFDIDFVVDKGSLSFARIFSKEIHGSFIVLDEEHSCGRVVYSQGSINKTIDFTTLRGGSIEEDLYKRDFTINSLALDLDLLQEEHKDLSPLLIDPYKGYQDLQEGIVRAVSKDIFTEDSVRILRAFTFASGLNFEIEPGTVKLIKDARTLLKASSFERIRDELFKIFSTAFSNKYILMMDELGILEEVFPQIEKMRKMQQGHYHHLDVWGHSLETLKELELVLIELEKDFLYYRQLEAYLNERLSAERTRRKLLKLIAIFHDVGKPQAFTFEDGKIKFHRHEQIGAEIMEDICNRLKLSAKEKHSLKNITLQHLRPGYLTDNLPISKRAHFRFFRDAGEDALSILLLCLADKRATRGPLSEETKSQSHQDIIRQLLEGYFLEMQRPKLAKLLTGDDLIKRLKLSPGPIIGYILREIEEAQSDGQVTTPAEALTLARKLKETDTLDICDVKG